MAFDPKNMAGNLKALRSKRGVTQKEAAAGMGIEEATLANYEQGNVKGGMSYEAAWKIADYYGVPIDQLGGREPLVLN